jgi:F-type H+-transporting ATPase subunit epsilon
MAHDKHFTCRIITPDRELLNVQATSVVFPAHDGQMGILHDRAPLLCKMGIGICRIETDAGRKAYFVDGGFARMLDNNLVLLTEDARNPEEIDRAQVQKELEQARQQKAVEPPAQQERTKAIRRAEAKLKLIQT